MASKQLEKHTALAIKAFSKGEAFPSAVFLPPALRDAPNVVYAFSGELPDVKQNLVRIQNECDPVGMMIAIAMGMPIATHHIKGKDENGEWIVETKFETLPLDSPLRERIIRTLGDKVIPRISVRATQPKAAGDSGASEWEATLGSAAERLEDE